MGFSLAEIGQILDAQRNKTIDCADGAKLIEKKMAEIRQKIADLKSIYRYLDEERANLEASAARQLELQQLAKYIGTLDSEMQVVAQPHFRLGQK